MAVLKKGTTTVIRDPASIRIMLRNGKDVTTIEDTPRVLDYIAEHGAPEAGSREYVWLDRKTGTVIQNPRLVSREEAGYQDVSTTELPGLMESHPLGSADDFESGDYSKIFLASDEPNEFLGFMRLQDEASKAELAAITDPMTGLYNRGHFDKMLSGAVEEARRKKQHLSLMVIDLNRFKSVNDIGGHVKGDETIKEFAEALKSILRESDVAFRIGGDEFAILFRDTDLKTAGKIAERLKEELAKRAIPHPTDQVVTASIGVAEYPWDTLSADESHKSKQLYEAADYAAGKAKDEFRKLTSYFRFDLKARPFRRPLAPGQIILAHDPTHDKG